MQEVKTLPRLMSSNEVESEINAIKEQMDLLYDRHRVLMHSHLTWLKHMRAVEGLKTYLHGATYAPEPEEEKDE